MKVSSKAMLAVAVMSGALALAQGVAATSAEESAESTAEGSPETAPRIGMMPMQQQMQRMHEQMANIHETTDPAARRKLLSEHMDSMQNMMQMMHGMMAGQDIMGRWHRRRQGGHMMGQEPSPTDKGMERRQGMDPQSMMRENPGQMGNMAERMNMMEQRVNMMQMMMDAMLQSQSEQLEPRE